MVREGHKLTGPWDVPTCLLDVKSFGRIMLELEEGQQQQLERFLEKLEPTVQLANPMGCHRGKDGSWKSLRTGEVP